MANINNNKYVTDKFGRTGIIEPTITASSNLEDITINVNSGTPTGTTTTVPIPDFWRASTVSATTLPTGLNSFTAKAQNSNDTTKFIQHSSDIFIGGANGLVRAGNGASNLLTNTCFGQNSHESITLGGNNTSIGYQAGQYVGNNAGSAWNTVLGRGAGQWGRGANYAFNTYIGGISGNSGGGNGGTYNSALGYSSLSQVNNGIANVAMGAFALSALTNSNDNTAVGYRSMGLASGTFYANSAIGKNSLLSLTTAIGNTGIGYLAGSSITTGGFNTIIGSGNGASAGTASGLTTGVDNIAIGSLWITGGGGVPNPIGSASQNILMGNGSAFKLTGNLNTIIGTYSGTITNGNNNVILGSYSYAPQTANGWSQTDAYPVNNNTFIGNDYNRNVTAQVAIGSNNTALGFNINQRIVGITNATAIGANTASTKSNQISMGDANVTEILLSGKLAIDINAIFGAADGTPIVVKTVGGIKTITIQ